MKHMEEECVPGLWAGKSSASERRANSTSLSGAVRTSEAAYGKATESAVSAVSAVSTVSTVSMISTESTEVAVRIRICLSDRPRHWTLWY